MDIFDMAEDAFDRLDSFMEDLAGVSPRAHARQQENDMLDLVVAHYSATTGKSMTRDRARQILQSEGLL